MACNCEEGEPELRRLHRELLPSWSSQTSDALLKRSLGAPRQPAPPAGRCLTPVETSHRIPTLLPWRYSFSGNFANLPLSHSLMFEDAGLRLGPHLARCASSDELTHYRDRHACLSFLRGNGQYVVRFSCDTHLLYLQSERSMAHQSLSSHQLVSFRHQA